MGLSFPSTPALNHSYSRAISAAQGLYIGDGSTNSGTLDIGFIGKIHDDAAFASGGRHYVGAFMQDAFENNQVFGAYFEYANNRIFYRVNTTGSNAASARTVPSGSNLSALVGQRFTLGISLNLTGSFDATLHSMIGDGGAVMDEHVAYPVGSHTSILDAPTGLFLGSPINTANVYAFPGFLLHAFVLNTNLTDEQWQALHAADDPGAILRLHRANMRALEGYGLNGDSFNGAQAGFGDTVLSNSIYSLNEGVAGGQAANPGTRAAATVAGTVQVADPYEHRWAPGEALVTSPSGYSNVLDTFVGKASLAPVAKRIAEAASASGRVRVGTAGNSRDARQYGDASVAVTKLATYDAGFVPKAGASYASGLGHHLTQALVAGAGCAIGINGFNYHCFSRQTGGGTAIPSSGTVTDITPTSSVSDVDVCRLFLHSTSTSSSVGPGRALRVPSGAAVQIPAYFGANFTRDDPFTFRAAVFKYPGAGRATFRVVSHPSTGGAPFPVTYGSATAETAEQTVDLDSGADATGTITSYTGGTTEIVVSSGLAAVAAVGKMLVVDGSAGMSFGVITEVDGTTLTLEHPMGTGASVPQASDAAHIGSMEYQWLQVDVPAGTLTGSAVFPCLQVACGADGGGADFPLYIGWVEVYGPNGYVIGAGGQGGNGASEQLANTFQTADAGTGRPSPLRKLLAFMDWDVFLFTPANQNVTSGQEWAAWMDWRDEFLAAGYSNDQLVFVADVVHSNTSAFTTAAATDRWGNAVLVNAGSEPHVAVQVWPALGTHWDQLIAGRKSDSSHQTAIGAKEFWDAALEQVDLAALAGGAFRDSRDGWRSGRPVMGVRG